jgi:hypothetical protein
MMVFHPSVCAAAGMGVIRTAATATVASRLKRMIPLCECRRVAEFDGN